MNYANLEALRAAPLSTDPFPYLVAPGFLSPEDLATVNADYPAIDSAASHSYLLGSNLGGLKAAPRCE